jgi:hypothetical protein
MNRERTASIRLAVAREDYAGALGLWNAYAAELGEKLRRAEMTATEMREASELFAWCRGALLAARAQLQMQLNRTHGAAAYLPRPLSQSGASGLIRARL